MEKALLIGDDVSEVSRNESGEGSPAREPAARRVAAKKRSFRPQFELSAQVLVTFRGLTVDENAVRYTQQRAPELGLNSAGTLHATLTRDGASDAYLVVVQASMGAQRYEHCARGDDAFSALKTVLDELITSYCRPRELSNQATTEAT